MDYIVEDYLEYLQEEPKISGFLIAGSLIYAIYKSWKRRNEIINAYCQKYKGDSIKVDICVAKKQLDNSKDIIRQLDRSKHTCEDTARPSRCYEKVRYYIQKYNDKIVDLNKDIYNLRLKLSKREYKSKMKKYKEKYQK